MKSATLTLFFARENRKEQMPKIGGIHGIRIPNSVVRIKDGRLYCGAM